MSERQGEDLAQTQSRERLHLQSCKKNLVICTIFGSVTLSLNLILLKFFKDVDNKFLSLFWYLYFSLSYLELVFLAFPFAPKSPCLKKKW